MATFEGKILQADAKPMKSGGTYYRLEIEGPGGSQWWTYFGELVANSIGAECQFGTRTTPAKGNYPAKEIIENYIIKTPGSGVAFPNTTFTDDPRVTTTPLAAPQAGTVAGHKDMWIATECIYQHAINALRIETLGELVTAMDRLVPLATAHAIKINESFKAYHAGKKPDFGFDQQAISAARSAEAGAQAHAGQESEHPGGPDLPFDDDIPM